LGWFLFYIFLSSREKESQSVFRY